jgi:hypothetical protein
MNELSEPEWEALLKDELPRAGRAVRHTALR